MSEGHRMKSGLFISHKGKRCGVYQYGLRVFKALECGKDIDWRYCECETADDASAALNAGRADIIIINFHPATIGWAKDFDWRINGSIVFSIYHEVYQEIANRCRSEFFDFLLCPDPTLIPYNPIIVPVPRIAADRPSTVPKSPEIFTVGSFGFATLGKGFDRICKLVNTEFDQACIRLNIPLHDSDEIVSKDLLGEIMENCRSEITKPGIDLLVTHEFFDDEGLLTFLSENSLNAFLYDEQPCRGISSCADYAIASGKPLAISKSSMLRHLHNINPSICVEDSSLKSIAARGGKELAHIREAWSYHASGAYWERAILDAVERRALSRSVPDRRGLNKILDDRSRDSYTDALRLLEYHAPDMLSRKIERANIQQAFALDTALRFLEKIRTPRILALGSYEDTAVATLKELGYKIDEVDPNVNGIDLEDFYRANSARMAKYDLVLCVSVLEHVKNDALFVRMAADLMAPNGIAVFTVDFVENYRTGDRLPYTDERFYTTLDIGRRLMSELPDCALFDIPSWREGAEDFEYDECRYGFAAWVFRKLDEKTSLHSASHPDASPAWNALLSRPTPPHEPSRLAELNRNRIIYDLKSDEGPSELMVALKLARFLRKISWKIHPVRRKKWRERKSVSIATIETDFANHNGSV